MKLSFWQALVVAVFMLVTLPSFSHADEKYDSASLLVREGDNYHQAKNDSLAFTSYQKAANLGNAAGERKLGNCYFKGWGVPKNAEASLKWYRKSADQGDPLGDYDLGTCYLWGEGVTRNPAEAFQWFKKSALAGNLIGLRQVAFCYEIGRGTPKDNALALDWYRKAAETGDAESEYDLGTYYEEGTLTPKDDSEAVKWYQKAADQNYLSAESKLAFHYEKGSGVDQNLAQAKVWYHQAAKQGNAYAQDALKRLEGPRTLVEWVNDDTFDAQVLQAKGPVLVDYYATWCGPCRAYGPIVDKIAHEYKGRLKVVRVNLDDCPQLAKKYQVTSIPDSFIFNQGKLVYSWLGLTDQKEVESTLRAQLNLASSLRNENEEWNGEKAYDAKDYRGALKWFKKAVAHGNTDGETAIGILYLRGKGVAKSEKLAMKWFKQAATHGNTNAPGWIGQMYDYGQGGAVTTLAGSGKNGSADGKGAEASFNWPTGIAVDPSGTLYIGDSNNHLIRKITPEGVVSTFAGSGKSGSANGKGTAASFSRPNGIALDTQGNIYVSDAGNEMIRKITPDGLVSTFAGSGKSGSANGKGTSASFSNPSGIAVDGSGNLYVADWTTHLIRKITPEGLVSTLAGSGAAGAANGSGKAASFKNPWGIAVDAAGNVYVGDENNNLIRKITPEGLVTTLAGGGSDYGANGTGTQASFNSPWGVAVDGAGNVYVVDAMNYKIRKITPDGVVSTIAGSNNGSQDGRRSEASFWDPTGIAVDSTGTIYVTDSMNSLVRKITVK